MQTKNECKKCKSCLWDYASGSLDNNQSQWTFNHIENCPSCAAEYSSVKKILTAMSSVPEPSRDFEKTLHAKLVSASIEMETERKKSNSFKEKLEKSRTYGGWKVVAPALVCLTLTIGVFSTGLYQRWMNSDDVIQSDYSQVQTSAPVITEEPTPAPVKTEYPDVSVTPDNNLSDNSNNTVIPSPADNADIEITLQDENANDISTVPMPASEPMIVSEPIPAAEPVEETEPANIGRALKNQVYLVQIDGVDRFVAEHNLNDCKTDIQPSSLVPGLSGKAVVLKLDLGQ